MEIYLTAEVPMGINIDQLRVQRNRYQMTPSNVACCLEIMGEEKTKIHT